MQPLPYSAFFLDAPFIGPRTQTHTRNLAFSKLEPFGPNLGPEHASFHNVR